MASVEFTDRCLSEDFEEIPENVEDAILKKVDLLVQAPLFGKPLEGPLKTFRRLTHGAYRILYRYHRPSDTVFIVMVALRKDADVDDVYARANRLLRAGRLAETVEEIKEAAERTRSNIALVKASLQNRGNQKERG